LSRSKIDGESKYDEVCSNLIRGIIERVYSSGVGAAQEYLKEFCNHNPLLGYDSVCVGFAQSLVKSFAELDSDHAVVEAVLRGDKAWAERCLAAARSAQEALYLQEEDKVMLRVLEHAFAAVLDELAKGLKPKLGG